MGIFDGLDSIYELSLGYRLKRHHPNLRIRRKFCNLNSTVMTATIYLSGFLVSGTPNIYLHARPEPKQPKQ